MSRIRSPSRITPCGERIPDARKRFGSGGGKEVELPTRVAHEQAGKTPGREMERLAGMCGHIAVHVDHGLEDELLLVTVDGDHGVSFWSLGFAPGAVFLMGSTSIQAD